MFLKLVKSGVEKTSEYSMKTSLNVFLGLSWYKLDWNRARSAIVSTRFIIGKYYFLRHQKFLIFDINFFWKKSSSNFAGFSDAFFRRSETVWLIGSYIFIFTVSLSHNTSKFRPLVDEIKPIKFKFTIAKFLFRL